MESTIYSVNDASQPLNNFQDVTVTEIIISPRGDTKSTNGWVIHGKAVLGNQDGDAQNASAWLVLMNGDTPTVIDRADVRIDQYGNTVSICLLAVVPASRVSKSCEVELHCTTYRGLVGYARLIAMSTDTAIPQPSNI